MAEQKWKEVEGDSSFWNGGALKENDEITGMYKTREENVGMNQSNVYVLDVNGKDVKVWGSTVLDEKMSGVATGQIIKIVFAGLSIPKAGRKAAKLYKVYQSES